MNKKTFIEDIARNNRDVNDLFMVIKKGIYSARNNKKYMSLSLRDRTGVIDAKVWDDVDRLAPTFEKNDVVRISARTEFFQTRPQLIITSIRKADEELSLADMTDFFPGSETGKDQLKDEYLKLVGDLKNPHLARIFRAFHDRDDLTERFFLFPASVGVHHVYIGGLLEHSLSVAKMAREAVRTIGGDMDIVVAGSLLHDIGKLEEIEFKGGFRYTDKGRLLGHITLGTLLFEDFMKIAGNLPDTLSDVMKHIIISHHGVEEWGSPRRPMCIEALIVHYLDNMDAKVMGVREHMRNSMEDERWTEWHRLYESRFYKLPEGNNGD